MSVFDKLFRSKCEIDIEQKSIKLKSIKKFTLAIHKTTNKVYVVHHMDEKKGLVCVGHNFNHLSEVNHYFHIYEFNLIKPNDESYEKYFKLIPKKF